MTIWRRVKQDFLAALAGVQEATVAVADRVHHRVQEVKTSIDAGLLEKQIETDQAFLGEKVYQRDHSDLAALYREPELRELFDKIIEEQRKLAVMETIVLPHESFMEFERIFLQSDFLIHHLVIPEKFHGVGKRMKELVLPPQMRLILIRKKNHLEMVQGSTIIEAHDEITFLSSKVNLQRYLDFWKNS
jgi:hypothetical protein